MTPQSSFPRDTVDSLPRSRQAHKKRAQSPSSALKRAVENANKISHKQDTELLKMILRAGGHSVPDATLLRILQDSQGIGRLLTVPSTTLTKHLRKHLPAAVYLQTLIEFVRRALEARGDRGIYVRNWDDLQSILRNDIAYRPEERAAVYYFNTENKLIDIYHHDGGVNFVRPVLRSIVHKAFNCGASALIFAHNHPSGRTDPSREDIEYSRFLSESLFSVDLKLHDSIIVTSRGCISMRREGLLNDKFGYELLDWRDNNNTYIQYPPEEIKLSE